MAKTNVVTERWVEYAFTKNEFRTFVETLREQGFRLEERLMPKDNVNLIPRLTFVHPDGRNLSDLTQPLFGFASYYDNNYGGEQMPDYRIKVWGKPAAGINVKRKYNIVKSAFRKATHQKFPFD